MSSSQISQPRVSIALASADAEVANADFKTLLVGQFISGTGTDGVIDVNISSAGAPENALYGQASQLASMIRAFKRVNKVSRVDALPLADAAGTARVIDFTLAGTATAAGTVTVVVGSETLHKFEVAIPDTTTAVAAHALIIAAINADLSCPMTAGGIAPAFSLTADNLGAVANDLGVEVITDTAGITLSVQVAEDTAGATDPTLTGVLDVATERYQGIVWPYGGTLAVVQAFLAAREDASNAVLDGVSLSATVEIHADHLTALNALNDRNVVIFADKLESELAGSVKGYIGPAQNEPTYDKAAYFAGIRALRMTVDASISRFLTSSASLDQFGGTALASLPYFNTSLPDFPVIASGRGWTDVEIEQLHDAGGAVMGVNLGGTGALVGEVPTTYKTDSASNVDLTFKYLNYVDTTSQIREYYFNNFKKRFAQSRLTEGAVSRGRDMVNAVVFRAYCEQLYIDLAGPDFVLVQDGEVAIAFYKDNLTVVLDLALGKITTTMLVPIVTQLRTIIATIKIAFSTTGS